MLLVGSLLAATSVFANAADGRETRERPVHQHQWVATPPAAVPPATQAAMLRLFNPTSEAVTARVTAASEEWMTMEQGGIVERALTGRAIVESSDALLVTTRLPDEEGPDRESEAQLLVEPVEVPVASFCGADARTTSFTVAPPCGATTASITIGSTVTRGETLAGAITANGSWTLTSALGNPSRPPRVRGPAPSHIPRP